MCRGMMCTNGYPKSRIIKTLENVPTINENNIEDHTFINENYTYQITDDSSSVDRQAGRQKGTVWLTEISLLRA